MSVHGGKATSVHGGVSVDAAAASAAEHVPFGGNVFGPDAPAAGASTKRKRSGSSATAASAGSKKSKKEDLNMDVDAEEPDSDADDAKSQVLNKQALDDHNIRSALETPTSATPVAATPITPDVQSLAEQSLAAHDRAIAIESAYTQGFLKGQRMERVLARRAGSVVGSSAGSTVVSGRRPSSGGKSLGPPGVSDAKRIFGGRSPKSFQSQSNSMNSSLGQSAGSSDGPLSRGGKAAAKKAAAKTTKGSFAEAMAEFNARQQNGSSMFDDDDDMDADDASFKADNASENGDNGSEHDDLHDLEADDLFNDDEDDPDKERAEHTDLGREMKRAAEKSYKNFPQIHVLKRLCRAAGVVECVRVEGLIWMRKFIFKELYDLLCPALDHMRRRRGAHILAGRKDFLGNNLSPLLTRRDVQDAIDGLRAGGDKKLSLNTAVEM